MTLINEQDRNRSSQKQKTHRFAAIATDDKDVCRRSAAQVFIRMIHLVSRSETMPPAERAGIASPVSMQSVAKKYKSKQ
jgi:hypothetical protein